MARNSQTLPNPRLRAHIMVGIAVAAAVLLAAVFVFYASEQFLIRDARFTLAEAPESGYEITSAADLRSWAANRSLEVARTLSAASPLLESKNSSVTSCCHSTA